MLEFADLIGGESAALGLRLELVDTGKGTSERAGVAEAETLGQRAKQPTHVRTTGRPIPCTALSPRKKGTAERRNDIDGLAINCVELLVKPAQLPCHDRTLHGGNGRFSITRGKDDNGAYFALGVFNRRRTAMLPQVQRMRMALQDCHAELSISNSRPARFSTGMSLPRHTVWLILGALTCSATLPLNASLTHRYSFTGDSVKDSAGQLGATLKGAGAKLVDGKLVLKNEGSTAYEDISHLEFAGSLLPKGATTASFEIWFTAKDVADFSRLLDIGTSEGTEGVNFIYVSPRTGDGSARVAITGSDVGSKTFIDVEALDDGKPHMLAFTFDGTAKKLRVFVDGKEPKPAESLGDNTLDKVKPVNNRMGKSSFSADPGLSASIDEVRVFDTALTPEEVAAAFKAGPDALPEGAK